MVVVSYITFSFFGKGEPFKALHVKKLYVRMNNPWQYSMSGFFSEKNKIKTESNQLTLM